MEKVNSCLGRFSWHLKDLRRNDHHCADLQKDFNKYGIGDFEATVIDSGHKWKSKGLRCEEEERLIISTEFKNLYNIQRKGQNNSPHYKSSKDDGQVLLTKSSKVLNKPHFFCPAFTEPCLYKIKCLKNNKIYIGESQCCLNRLSAHLDALVHSTHHCPDLQKDFFLTIISLRAYINEKGLKNGSLLRPLSEHSFRRRYLNHESPQRSELVFIKTTKQFQQYKVYGKIYFGVQEIVTNKLVKNKRQANYRLSSSTWPDYEYINKTKLKKNRRTLSIDGQTYTSDQAIAKGLVNNQSTLYARLKSKTQTWKTWFWVDNYED